MNIILNIGCKFIVKCSICFDANRKERLETDFFAIEELNVPNVKCLSNIIQWLCGHHVIGLSAKTGRDKTINKY